VEIPVTITYEQFKIVVQDPDARAAVGLHLTDGQALDLQDNEAQSIAYFATWRQVATQSAASGELHPFHGPAIAGFVIGVCAYFVFPVIWLSFLLAFVGLCFSAFSLKPIRIGAKRGRAFAIAGLVLSIVAIALGVLNVIARTHP
jgi:hypothetical protein